MNGVEKETFSSSSVSLLKLSASATGGGDQLEYTHNCTSQAHKTPIDSSEAQLNLQLERNKCVWHQ